MTDEMPPQTKNISELEHKFNILERINNLITFSGNVEKVLEKILDLVLEYADVEYGIIYLLRLDNNTLKFGVLRSRGVPELKGIDVDTLKNHRLFPGQGVAGRVYERNVAEIIPDCTQDKRYLVDWMDLSQYTIHNCLSIPLLFKDSRIGVLELFNKKPEGTEFIEEHIHQLGAVISQISVVIENARLHALMNHKLEEMNVLFSAMSLVNSSMTLDEVLDNLMSMAMKIIDAEASSIILYDEETNTLSFVAASGVKKDEIRKISLKKGEGIAGWVAEHGETLLISDVSRDARFSGRVDQYSGFQTESILAVPLKLENKVIGVVEAINKKGGGIFTFNDRRLLDTFAFTGAMAIQKAKLFEDLNDLFIATIRSMADAIEAKDPYTRGHSERIRRISLMIADRLNLSQAEKNDLGLSALLHDIGKIGVPESILLKEGKLTDAEWVWMKRHPSIGADMLSHIKQLKNAIGGIRNHQERWDGKGYPDNLAGNDIPLLGRIICVADAFDAMTSNRPYRKSLTLEYALEEIRKCAGSQFDPVCAQAFLDGYEEMFKYKKQESL